MDKIENKQGRLQVAVPIAILLIGLILIGYLIVGYIRGTQNDTFRILVPGEKNFNLTKPGKYTIFYEFRSVVNGKNYETEGNLAGLRCALTDLSTGKAVLLLDPSGYSHYNNWDREGTSVLEFKIKRPGKYQFSGWYEEGKSGEKVVLAVGPDDGGLIVLILECAGLFIVAVGLSVLTAFGMMRKPNIPS